MQFLQIMLTHTEKGLPVNYPAGRSHSYRVKWSA